MKKYYTLLIFLSAFLSANAQDIFFIDAGLKATLLATNTTNQAYAQDQDHNYVAIDANADGEIQQSEALAVYHLDIAYIDLYDLTGLEYFANLESLDIAQASITILNVSVFPGLKRLSCRHTPVTTIQLNEQIEQLDCPDNEIDFLDLSNSPLITSLDCSNNNISSLDIIYLPNLVYLNCNNNEIHDLIFQNAPQLVSLNCNANNISSLDITGKVHLTSLECSDNSIAVDLAGVGSEAAFGFPFWLDVRGNNLVSLDLSMMQNIPVNLQCDEKP